MGSTKPKKTVSLVAAVCRNRIIGKGNDLVWRDKLDMDRFVELTTGKTVIMGRKTWDFIPQRYRPLRNRENLIVTRNPTLLALPREEYDDTTSSMFVPDLTTAIDLAQSDAVMVIGGSQIYEQALPIAKHMYLTEVELDIDGDAEFPFFNPRMWHCTNTETHVNKHGVEFRFCHYMSVGDDNAVFLPNL